MSNTVEIETGPAPHGSVIWLHGLGADGHDFEPVVPELQLPESLPLRFVFPHAPLRPVTINGGMTMRAWYDIVSLDRDGAPDGDGIRESSAILDGLIEREQERGIAPEKIVAAGFSQGGAIVLHNAIWSRRRVAGLMALSTYLPLLKTVQAEQHDPRTDPLPVFMAHGTQDPMIPCQSGRDSAAALRELGYDVGWQEYPMGHSVCPQEIDAIREWLIDVYAS